MRLHLDDHRTTLIDGASPPVTLDVGIRTLAEKVFRRDPPAPAELERAIDVVEDALMAAGLRHAPRGELSTADPLLHAMLDLHEDGAQRTRDEVEARFSRLAADAQGRRSGPTGLPPGREGAAALLILRECMHHLGFDRIQREGG